MYISSQFLSSLVSQQHKIPCSNLSYRREGDLLGGEDGVEGHELPQVVSNLAQLCVPHGVV